MTVGEHVRPRLRTCSHTESARSTTIKSLQIGDGIGQCKTLFSGLDCYYTSGAKPHPHSPPKFLAMFYTATRGGFDFLASLRRSANSSPMFEFRTFTGLGSVVDLSLTQPARFHLYLVPGVG